MTRFLALDTDTANDHPASICRITIAEAGKRGRVRPVFESLVNPEVPFDRQNIGWHGITATKVAGAPTFAQIAPLVADQIRGRVVYMYGENQPQRLSAAFKRAHQPLPSFKWQDAYLLACRTWDLRKEGMKDVAAHH